MLTAVLFFWVVVDYRRGIRCGFRWCRGLGPVKCVDGVFVFGLGIGGWMEL